MEAERGKTPFVFFLPPITLLVGMNLQRAVLSHNKRACRFSYLQRLEEAKGAQSPAAGHQTEGGVVEHLLVVVPAETQHERWVHWHQQGRDIYSGRLRCICAITRTHIYLFVSPFLNVTIYYVVFILIFPGCIGWEKKAKTRSLYPKQGHVASETTVCSLLLNVREIFSSFCHMILFQKCDIMSSCTGATHCFTQNTHFQGVCEAVTSLCDGGLILSNIFHK